MKVETVTGMDGRRVVTYLPENGADAECVRKKAEAEELDDRESFGDADPGTWEE